MFKNDKFLKKVNLSKQRYLSIGSASQIELYVT